MTYDEHKKHHKELHRAFDELLADFIYQNNKLPSEISISELMKWSYKQTLNPTNIND